MCSAVITGRLSEVVKKELKYKYCALLMEILRYDCISFISRYVADFEQKNTSTKQLLAKKIPSCKIQKLLASFNSFLGTELL